MQAGLLTYKGAIYPWHCDHMGHMNVMWYVGKFDEAGDIITIHSALIEMKDKSIRFIHEVRKTDRGEIAATTTLTGVHLDTVARRACAFPSEIKQREAVLRQAPATV